uniref:CSON014564 protein n=1 Tax=Culicoides sonorensis TaxID=179676 RepID=A0A336KSM0_CULSO
MTTRAGSSGKGIFSDSPSHLETRSELDTEKKVELLASVATALAKYDLPVPGGPNNKIPFHGTRFP